MKNSLYSMVDNTRFAITIFALLTALVFSACQQKENQYSDDKPQQTLNYNQAHRPQFHFSPEANWMNDPNGMFYYDSTYHLFYQYYPDSTVWGPMHWGHAISNDMVHWEHMPIALYPDSLGCIFSGGAVVDNMNTSGLGKDGIPPVVASFTHHNFEGEKAGTNDFQIQSIAYSQDGGFEWIKYDGNPVIPNTEKIKDFRDPKVVWHEPSQKWILVLAAYDRVKFYGSENLLDWKFLSDFGIDGDNRLWECPDLIKMDIQGTDESKWVLIVSIQKEAPNRGTGTSYFVGDFDGQEFKADTADQKWLDWGTDNYAFVTWHNIPDNDGRTLGIGWMSNWQYAQIVPTEIWRSAMTLPRELRLVKTKNEYHIHALPARELENLRSTPLIFDSLKILEQIIIDSSENVSQCELVFNINLEETTSENFGLILSNNKQESLTLTFSRKENLIILDRTQSSVDKFSEVFYEKPHTAPLDMDVDNIKVDIFIDASSIEIFINDGALNFTGIFFPSLPFGKMSFFSEEGPCQLYDFKLYPLKGIWEADK